MFHNLIVFRVTNLHQHTPTISGQIIATSHDLTPNGGDCKGNPLISGKSRLVKYYSIWPDYIQPKNNMLLFPVGWDAFETNRGRSNRRLWCLREVQRLERQRDPFLRRRWFGLRSFLWLHGDRLKKSCFLKFGEVVVVANFLFCQKYAQHNRSILAHFFLTSASMCGTVLCP